MARAQEVTPAGDREKWLLELVEKKFDGNVASFARTVAQLTGKSWETEKSAFYRIVRGEQGRLVDWRLGHYATALGFTGRFLQVWKEGEEEADESVLPQHLSPREVRDALVTVLALVDDLVARVERLEQQRQPRTRKAATPR